MLARAAPEARSCEEPRRNRSRLRLGVERAHPFDSGMRRLGVRDL